VDDNHLTLSQTAYSFLERMCARQPYRRTIEEDKSDGHLSRTNARPWPELYRSFVALDGYLHDGRRLPSPTTHLHAGDLVEPGHPPSPADQHGLHDQQLFYSFRGAALHSSSRHRRLRMVTPEEKCLYIHGNGGHPQRPHWAMSRFIGGVGPGQHLRRAVTSEHSATMVRAPATLTESVPRPAPPNRTLRHPGVRTTDLEGHHLRSSRRSSLTAVPTMLETGGPSRTLGPRHTETAKKKNKT